ncbi:Gluconate 5-dehydrogenase [Aquisphaera giovannonii]|uniref:Gluconate 5-dehydrogenase n=1 Tax=Aquisphaera giovannonii TaxID=406548 RepID=A0A5B9W4U9_9BACT|nr:SDR family oxidoreductase [Aquisphaera giovannonii]QEH35175.1 Gluconate 5-dehydrogenase [Aquisphaera giovannonii]
MSDSLDRYFSLSGKVALVTGASGGIGRALAAGLAGAGAAVALHGRSEGALAETALAVERAGATSLRLVADLSDPGSCDRVVAACVEGLGRLDVLVNCAGMNRRKPMDEFTGEDFDAIVGVNLRAPFLLSRAARRAMKAQGGGKVVHVASLTSSVGLARTAIYGMTKAALAQLAKTQAVEWAADNIQVNCLAPGFILTPLTEGLWSDPGRMAWLKGRVPARRPGEPDEMVAAVLLMAGPGSSYLTGQMITVDGGFLAGGSWDDDGPGAVE